LEASKPTTGIPRPVASLAACTTSCRGCQRWR
jgi:hypothetical protein